EVDLEAFGQCDEGVDAAAFGGGDPAAQMLAGAARWVGDAGEIAQLFFERPGTPAAAVGAGALGVHGTVFCGEVVFPRAQRPAGGAPLRRGHRGASWPGGGLRIHPVKGAVDPLQDVEGVLCAAADYADWVPVPRV